MKALVLAVALVSVSAQAELYRWIDPDSGSVKYSTVPPYDGRVSAQVVRHKAPAAAPPPAAPSPTAPQPPQPDALAALETSWSELLRQISGLTPQDFRRAGERLKQQLEAYNTLSAELDRVDPGGAERRRAQSEGVLERLKKK